MRLGWLAGQASRRGGSKVVVAACGGVGAVGVTPRAVPMASTGERHQGEGSPALRKADGWLAAARRVVGCSGRHG